jgi:pilus assembly protein CpaE
MRGPIRTLVALEGGFSHSDVESVLNDPGIEIVSVVEEPTEWEALHNADGDALVIACGEPSDAALDLIGEASRRRPDRPVVVACVGSPNGLTRQVLERGADDIVLVSNPDLPSVEAFFALEKALARKSGSIAAATGMGQLIAVLGPKGGIGKTLTAANLSVSLALEGASVALVDLDLQFGDLGLSMGLPPNHTIFDLVLSGGSLDEAKVKGYLTPHPSGVEVLLAPVRPDQASSITIDFLRDLYCVLRLTHDYVIVDTPPKFDPEVIVTVDNSTSVCMVGMLDAPSLKNTRLGLETLDLMGYNSDRVRVLLNRADTNVGISNSDAIAILGRKPDILIPSSREVVRSVNAGEPIAQYSSRSEPAKAFRSLAGAYESVARERRGSEKGDSPELVGQISNNGNSQPRGHKRRFGLWRKGS